ncbi:MAG: hypothetical protein EHM21_01940 [Chloroflexi bacterium]|nr:MAG: hypothetical protein EHM21_01940 [Chloroflexota bacterium]
MSGYPPIQLHPDNPHYFLFRGLPTLLITSAEHYGAVINLDFDYFPYLDVLAAYGLNCTRIYSGAYIEPEHYFIHDNTLGPRPGRQCLPWSRSDVPGYPLGGNKFDLDHWDTEYFRRLGDFISEAGKRGIVVEICLFNAAYPDTWPSMPLYFENNLQGVGRCACKEVQTLKDAALVARHEDYVRKITQEVNGLDNVILEICDEPGLHGAPPEEYTAWISRLMDIIVETEANLPNKHLIAQQVCGSLGGLGDFSPDPRLSVITGQYVGPNDGKQFGGIQLLDTDYGYNRPVELNETAFYPIWYEGDRMGASRVEAWEFILGGGASFNHLNGLYSTFNPAATGTENDQVLSQLKILKTFIETMDFIRMQRDAELAADGVPEGAFARAISEPGLQYALYLHHSRNENVKYVVQPGEYQERLLLNFLPGRYQVEWVEPATGRVLRRDQVRHEIGCLELVTPPYSIDIALRANRS